MQSAQTIEDLRDRASVECTVRKNHKFKPDETIDTPKLGHPVSDNETLCYSPLIRRGPDIQKPFWPVSFLSMITKKRKRTTKKKPPCPDDILSNITMCKEPIYSFNQADKWKAQLETNGYAVVSNVVSPEDTKKLIDTWWSDLGKLNTGIDEKDATTLKKENVPGIVSVGIFKDPTAGFAHSLTAWEGRRLVHKLFTELWGTTDLITSYDTVSLFPNWTLKGLERSKTKSCWLHVDQGQSVQETCYQGMLVNINADASTGSLVVVPGSHRWDISSTNPNSNYIPVNFSSENLTENIRRRGVKMVSAPAGSVILWNSKIIHANHHALQTPTTDNPVLRMNNYVCMVPRPIDQYDQIGKIDKQGTARIRQLALEERWICNHWPYIVNQQNNKHNYIPMKREYLSYPRHKQHKKLHSVALELDLIRSSYGYMC